MISQPASIELANAISTIVWDQPLPLDRIEIVDRALNPNGATFHTEIVTCRIDREVELKLFCKYGGDHPNNHYDLNLGLRQGGVPYEARVYKNVLVPLDRSPIRFFSNYPDTGPMWLVLENIEDGLPASHGSVQDWAVPLAGRWIGSFHRLWDASQLSTQTNFLRVYDADYYVKWPRNTLLFADPLLDTYPWLRRACVRSEPLIDQLTSAPPTVIHGDYYADNVVCRDRNVYPLDWAWAAWGAGENDLAALTERWPPAVVSQCELEYETARWPSGPPEDFMLTLDVARLFLLFRWLGDQSERTLNVKSAWRFEHLYSVAERLGLVG